MSVLSEILFVIVAIVATVAVGLVISWLVRKVSAMVHYRIGPPVLQPVWDVMKLMGKETLIPSEAQRGLFMSAPLVGMAGAMLLSVVLLHAAVWPAKAFIGDVIVVLYLTLLPSLALILGSSASASPHATVGTGREMKLVMAYELPLILALIVAIIKSGGAISLAGIVEAGNPVWSISGMIAFFVALFCIQAKLGFVPFDMAEAETELASGVMVEYSGALLAVWTLMHAMMLVGLPLFLVIVFLGGISAGFWGVLAGIGKYVLVVVLVILIKNTNPRVRIDQAMKFFWVYCGIAMALAVVLAIIGNISGLGWL
jgi:NADH-quinone oxidoreductase subunit H